MLLLREGHRDIHITFGLEEDSISYFKELIATTEQSSHETGRVLNDAFLLELIQIGLLRRNVSDPVIQLFLPDGRNEA